MHARVRRESKRTATHLAVQLLEQDGGDLLLAEHVAIRLFDCLIRHSFVDDEVHGREQTRVALLVLDSQAAAVAEVVLQPWPDSRVPVELASDLPVGCVGEGSFAGRPTANTRLC